MTCKYKNDSLVPTYVCNYVPVFVGIVLVLTFGGTTTTESCSPCVSDGLTTELCFFSITFKQSKYIHNIRSTYIHNI